MPTTRKQPHVPKPRAEQEPAASRPAPPDLHKATSLGPKERGAFVGRHVVEIQMGLELIKKTDVEDKKRTTRAALIGYMFSELKMFGDPPPDTIPEGFTQMVEDAEEDSREGSFSRLLMKHEDHPSIMALDTVIDKVGSGERVDAIQMLRAATMLVERSERE